MLSARALLHQPRILSSPTPSPSPHHRPWESSSPPSTSVIPTHGEPCHASSRFWMLTMRLLHKRTKMLLNKSLLAASARPLEGVVNNSSAQRLANDHSASSAGILMGRCVRTRSNVEQDICGTNATGITAKRKQHWAQQLQFVFNAAQV